MKQKLIHALEVYIKDKDRKPYWRTACELALCFAAERGTTHYFSHLLYKRGCRNFLNYIGSTKMRRIQNELFNSKEALNPILCDKILFQQFLNENNLPGPRAVGTIKNRIFFETYSNSNADTEVTSEQTLFQLITALASSDLSLFIKPVDGIGGAHTFKVQKDNLSGEAIRALYEQTSTTNFIIQEALEQHKQLSILYPKSINTLRVNTFKRSDDTIVIASALLRMGLGGLVVDNVTSGGLYVPLDLETGMLDKTAYAFFKNGGNSYTTHPDTGLLFESFKYPKLDEMKALVLKAATLINNKIVGWDIAMTPNGPVLIEGNHNPHLTMLQRACGGFKNHPVYSEAFKEYI